MQEASGQSAIKKTSVGKAALWMASGTLASRILGLIRDMTMAAAFDRTVTDAWLVAFRLPNLFRRILGEGSLSVTFIPAFIKKMETEGLSQARDFASAMWTLLLCLLIPLCGLGIIYSEQIVGLFTPGEAYQSIPGKVEMTVIFAKIMFSFLVLVSLYAFFMAVLQSLGRFGLAAFAPTLLNICLIASAWVPQNWFTLEGEELAWAVLVGGFLQVALLVPTIVRLGLFPRLVIRFLTPEVKGVLLRMLPSVVGLGIMQMTILVNTRFASRLPEGTNSWIFWADRILEFPLSLFAVSLGSALLPTMSRHWSQGDTAAMSRDGVRFLKSILTISLPIAVFTYFLAPQIVTVLFERGNFSAHDSLMTAQILQIYSVAILAYSVVRVLAPMFYAMENTWFPALVSALSLTVHVVMAPFWIEAFQIQGLVFSTVLSSAMNGILLMLGLRFWIGPIWGRDLILHFIKLIVIGSLVALSCIVIGNIQMFETHYLDMLSQLILSAVVFVAVVYAFGSFIGVGEVVEIKNRILNRFKRT
ncbi:MAG: murein biosynthesis integral membrane protein MurJ [Bdellovibrionales bacterium CG10_big_fil_rev_8_21_14_0_10_45_34]|nr:MAG: murein biosynthesis integral membrane protein MurJ [Bdellovibrionales bacterium CG10_big_fil_rev_8_21_14_0_10_45_34]